MVYLLIYFTAVCLTHDASAASDPLNVLAELITSRSARQDSESSDDAGQEYFNTRTELLFADLQVRSTGLLSAQRFFHKATRFGLPTTEGLRFFDNYIVSYDRRLKNPVWVLQHWDARDFKKEKVTRRRLRNLYHDATIPEMFQATGEDYKGSRYERGHMMASSRNVCPAHFHQTYYITNIVPQFHDLNSGLMFRLECYIEYLAVRSKNMYIITGSLYLPPGGTHYLAVAGDDDEVTLTYSVIGRTRVAVPSHFYKVFVREHTDGELSMEAFLVENCEGSTRHVSLEHSRLDIDRDLPELEQAAGMTMFDIIDRTKIAKPHHTLHGFMENLLARTIR